jgi:hypothetical protein
MDIIVDTNMFLHFRRLDELDWCELSGAAHCSVVVAPVLMRELERAKVHNPNAKLRERAKDAVAWLASKIENEDPIALREEVTLIFDEQEPLIDFAEHRLSRDIADDHLIASALDWGMRSGHDVAIASADSGLALKLRSRPIHFLQPAEKWRLPDAVDVERAELRELRRELDRERMRRPSLTVQFIEGGTTIEAAPDPVERPRSAEELRASLPPMTLKDYTALDNRTEPGVRVYEHEPVDQYNKELEEYFAEYDLFLGRHSDWAEQEGRTIELSFVLANAGGRPASNIDVRLNFPTHVTTIAESRGPDEPDEPEPPVKPVPQGRSRQSGKLMAIPIGPEMPSESAPKVSRDCRSVDYFVRQLKHDCAEELDPILVLFTSREEMKPFSIEVMITCNEGDKVSNRLIVKPCPSEDGTGASRPVRGFCVPREDQDARELES